VVNTRMLTGCLMMLAQRPTQMANPQEAPRTHGVQLLASAPVGQELTRASGRFVTP